MKKVWVISGNKGSGKSTAIVTFLPPKDIDKLLVLDTEDSMSDMIGLGFKHVRMYDRLRVGGDMLDRLARGEVPWVDQAGRNALVGYYDYLIKVLNEQLENGKYLAVGIDTVGPIEAAMTAAVEAGRRVFGWSGTRAYGRMETEGVRPLYQGLLEAIAQRGVKDIILTSHLKNVWISDQPVVGKVRPGGRMKVLTTLSSGMFWLVPGDSPTGAPAALVLKARIGKIEPDGDGRGWSVRQILPERIPEFSWKAIEQYRAHPANLDNPAPGEVLSENEREMISDLLTDKQMELMILGAREQLSKGTSEKETKRTETVSVLNKEDTALNKEDTAVSMIAAGATNKEIVEATELPLPKVLAIRRKQ